MKITEVQAFPLSFRLVDAPRRGSGQPVKKDTVVVRVRTEDGITGYGESHHALAPTVVAALVNQNLAPIVVGADAMAIEQIWQTIYIKQGQTHGPGWALYKALSGVDMALWDARAKALELPVWRLLGGEKRKIRAYAGGVSFGFKAPSALLEEAQGYVSQGFTAIKLRLGDSVHNDIERVRAVRLGLGGDVDIMVDINTRYTYMDMQRALPALEELDVFWIEEPFTPDNLADYAHFNARTRLPIAAGENHFTRFQARQLLETAAVDIIQPDPAKAGGITECKKIADLASAFRRPLAPHTGLSAIDAAACVHLLCAASNALIYEADCAPYNPFRDELCSGAPAVIDGWIEPSDRPGLGFDLDESLFTRMPGIAGPCYQ
ncbi:MAG: mandelate racemase/muconate lactonizing enzyme family protein [Proteobacteria bacterium]|nr:mandelate racemase/muconate lactonizing enzyme family protein [Burkholderiales bacterium]